MDERQPTAAELSIERRVRSRRAVGYWLAFAAILLTAAFVLDRPFAANVAGVLDIGIGVLFGGFSLAVIRRRGGIAQALGRPALFFYLASALYLIALGYGLLNRPPTPPVAIVGDGWVVALFLFGLTLDIYIFFRRLQAQLRRARQEQEGG